jgi:hypothetical protein
MPVLTEETLGLPLPSMLTARQVFEAPRLADAIGAVRTELNKPAIRQLLRPGQRIAVAVGSRGIHDIARLTRALIDGLKDAGAVPFIVPAMGSHGGATAEGQQRLLAGYGISAETMGVPLISSMETVMVGATAGGIPIHLSKDALAADLIVAIARIKPHTDFRGPVESGLCKMLAIGLGKHVGCSRLHREGVACFDTLIPDVAARIIDRAPVGFGLAIIENAYDETAHVEAVVASEFLTREPALLVEAKRLMPRILFSEIDVLVIKRIGKDVTGAGMDSNIVGRTTKGTLAEFSGPLIKRIVVLGLTEATAGNAIGIGLADFTVKDILARIDHQATDANCIASSDPEAGRIPIALTDEAEATRAALSCTPGVDLQRARIVRIENTLDLKWIEFSEPLLDEARREPRLVVESRQSMREGMSWSGPLGADRTAVVN